MKCNRFNDLSPRSLYKAAEQGSSWWCVHDNMISTYVIHEIKLLSLTRVRSFYPRGPDASTQQTRNICITFIQRRPNVFVGQTLYKWYTNVLCLLGIDRDQWMKARFVHTMANINWDGEMNKMALLSRHRIQISEAEHATSILNVHDASGRRRNTLFLRNLNTQSRGRTPNPGAYSSSLPQNKGEAIFKNAGPARARVVS